MASKYRAEWRKAWFSMNDPRGMYHRPLKEFMSTFSSVLATTNFTEREVGLGIAHDKRMVEDALDNEKGSQKWHSTFLNYDELPDDPFIIRKKSSNQVQIYGHAMFNADLLPLDPLGMYLSQETNTIVLRMCANLEHGAEAHRKLREALIQLERRDDIKNNKLRPDYAKWVQDGQRKRIPTSLLTEQHWMRQLDLRMSPQQHWEDSQN